MRVTATAMVLALVGCWTQGATAAMFPYVPGGAAAGAALTGPNTAASPPPPLEAGSSYAPSGVSTAAPSGQPSPPLLRAPVPPAEVGAAVPANVIAQGTKGDAEHASARLSADELPNAGYVPGYRVYQGLSLSPYSPRAGAVPGGVTPAFGAPMPLEQWTFRWNGVLSASWQTGVGQRENVAPGQDGRVFHTPPQTIDEYASFVGTSTMPGQWAALNFTYAKDVVSINLSLNTWNPTQPTTYYQIGSQNFINNFYLQYDIPTIGRLKPRALLGYFTDYYGGLGQYGPGMYTNTLVGFAKGVGETVVVEYPLGPTWTLLLTEGFMGNRNGKVPDGVVPTGGNASNNPIFAASWVSHFHLGLQHTGEPTFKAQLHYMTNWAHDDRVQQAVDNLTTRQIDESYVKDGRIDVLGIDATMNSRTWGYLGVAGAVTQGRNTYPLKGLWTYGGDGQSLTDRWWGPVTGGTGKLLVAGINYSVSLGRVLTAPAPFTNDRPDVVLNTGIIVADTLTDTGAFAGTTKPGALPADVDTFNHRLRYKFGADVLYTFLSFMGAGARVDRVSPNSKDAGETFHVLAARLVFKSDWSSRDTITVLYGKWFYGPRSHPETNSIVAADIGRLDDQLIAINANMSW